MSNLHRALKFGAASLVCAAVCRLSLAAEPTILSEIAYPQTAEEEGPRLADASTIRWQGPVQSWPDETLPAQPGPIVEPVPQERLAPLLDDCNPGEHDAEIGQELMEGYPNDQSNGQSGRRGVQPYGGGHPGDWPWGCGGSPFRTGPGRCDNYRVGPIWDVTVDGMVMRREGTDLSAIWNETDGGMPGDMPGEFVPAPIEGPPQGIPELFENFDYAPGGRLSIIGKYPPWVGYQVHAGVEGIEKWEAVIAYPKFFPDPVDRPDLTEQRRVHYTSNFYSGELNILHCSCTDPIWRPYCGVRYMKFDDELNITDNQEALGPLDVIGPLPPLEVITTDMTNLFDLENNLMGFQVGLRHDYWKVNSRLAIEGFVNAGVYYNKIKYTNLMNITRVQRIGDTHPVSIVDPMDITNVTNTDGIPGTTQLVSATNLDSSDLSEIAYSYEASLSAVCRINKCWAMRAGYQVLWINGLRLADEAFLNPDNFLDNEAHSMLFQGWHAGIECRR